MSEITLSVPDGILIALQGNPESVAAELRLAAAVKLYELGRLSSGAAANLASIPRTLLLTQLADYGALSFRLTKDELRRDFEHA